MLKQIIRKNKQVLRVENFHGTYAIEYLKEVQAYFHKYHMSMRYRFRGSRRSSKNYHCDCLKTDASRFDVYFKD